MLKVIAYYYMMSSVLVLSLKYEQSPSKANKSHFCVSACIEKLLVGSDLDIEY